MSKANKIFSDASGVHTHGMYHPSTILKTIGVGAKDVAKRVGKVAYKHLVEPSVRVKRIKDAKMREMDRKNKAGEFNH